MSPERLQFAIVQAECAGLIYFAAALRELYLKNFGPSSS